MGARSSSSSIPLAIAIATRDDACGPRGWPSAVPPHAIACSTAPRARSEIEPGGVAVTPSSLPMQMPMPRTAAALVTAVSRSRRRSHDRIATRPTPWCSTKAIGDEEPAPPPSCLTALTASKFSYEMLARETAESSAAAAAAAASASGPGGFAAIIRSSSAHGHTTSASGKKLPSLVRAAPAKAGLATGDLGALTGWPSAGDSSAATLAICSAVTSAARCSHENEILVVDLLSMDVLPSALRTVMENSCVSIPVHVTSTRSCA